MKLSSVQFYGALALADRLQSNYFKVEDGMIVIGDPAEISEKDRIALLDLLKKFQPYRKGPFEIYGITIHANWKSNIKLRRLSSFIKKYNLLNGNDDRICDIGCNNGYFLASLDRGKCSRMTGLDPVEEFYQFYRILQTLCPTITAEFIPDGFKTLKFFPDYFSLSICMGLLYHVTDPVELLRTIHFSLKPQGHLILETIIHENKKEYPVSLIPDGKYAGMRGIWNIPDIDCVAIWLKRSGFHHIELLEKHNYFHEQVRTQWGDLPALTETLKENGQFTIEGYPAPKRAWFLAKR